MDECFCYNAHQSINNMVMVFINTVMDHLIIRPMYKVIYFATNKESSRAVYDSFNWSVDVYMQNNTAVRFQMYFGNVNNRLVD